MRASASAHSSRAIALISIAMLAVTLAFAAPVDAQAATAEISDFVWDDLNGDGIQDGGEPGVDGVVVTLWDEFGGNPAGIIASDTTAGGGLYSFDMLPAGNYFIQITPPAGEMVTLLDQGGDEAFDSDIDPATGYTEMIVLADNETNDTIDIGLVPIPFSSISDRVWDDTDGDGIQDGGEPGVDGVTVNLWDDDGNGAPNAIILTDTTAGGGLYLFDQLLAGTYHVEFVAPAMQDLTLQDQGGNDALDSDPDPVTGFVTVTLGANVDLDTVDAGLIAQPTASISNFVWNDANGNGIQDGEPGFSGVVVNLWDDDGNGNPNAIIDTETTGAIGLYAFGQLAGGTYHVEFVPPPGFMPTLQGQGGDDVFDSDPDPATGFVTVTLANAETNPNIDAGIVPIPFAEVSNFVWNDDDGNGIQDLSEMGVPNVVVNLYADDNGMPGALVDSVTTDVNGLYLLDEITPGTYHLEFVPPAGLMPTLQNQGGDDTIDSDADPATGFVSPLVLGDNFTTQDLDVGLVPIPASIISDFVWEDADADGIQDPAEIWATGVTVNLWSDDGAGNPDAIIDTDVTDNQGMYAFAGLASGTYHVEFVAPAGRTWTAVDQGGDDTIDSDADPADGFTDPIVIVAGIDNDTIDAGLLPPLLGSISDYVWADLDEDGRQDQAELPLPGIVVNLWSDDGNGNPNAIITSDTTDGNGLYEFLNLAPGTYHVEFVTPVGTGLTLQNVGGDDTIDSDGDPLTGIAGPINLPAGFDDDTIDAGIIPRSSISNFVWEDTNENGIQEVGELGLQGVTVNLWSDDGAGNPAAIIDTDVTDGSGLYAFELLADGTYHVEFVAPLDRVFIAQDQGGDDALDSDADPLSGFTAPIVLGVGFDDDTIDAGFSPFAPGTVGDLVWYDLDGDGLQDADEPGVPGVIVRVWESDAAGNIPPGTVPYITTTDADGEWSLIVPIGFYVANPSLPVNGIGFTQLDVGADDTIDSDVAPAGNPNVGFTDAFEVTVGEVQLDIDAGVLVANAIGDRVWDDTNEDGIQDAGEPGVAGVTVNLIDSNGNVEATTTTNSDGLYLFAGIPTDNYLIEVVLPANQMFSPIDQGGDDTLDSDINSADGLSDPVAIGSNTINTTVDAGLVAEPPSGDVNCDGQTDIIDALFISQYTVGNRVDGPCPLANPAGELYLAEGDVNNDGVTDIIDSLLISQCEVGINNVLCP